MTLGQRFDSASALLHIAQTDRLLLDIQVPVSANFNCYNLPGHRGVVAFRFGGRACINILGHSTMVQAVPNLAIRPRCQTRRETTHHAVVIIAYLLS